MQFDAFKSIHLLYIFTFLESLLKALQEFSTSKQIISHEIGLKRIISYHNQGHIIQELRTWAQSMQCN